MPNNSIAKMIICISMVMLFSSNDVLAANDLDKDKQFLLGPVQAVRSVSDSSHTSVVTTRLYRQNGSIELIEIGWTTKSIIYYDPSGRAIRYEEIAADGTKTITTTFYDDANHTYVTHYQQAGHPQKVRGSLDKSGKIIDAYKYGLDGEYEGKTINTYNDAGLVTEMNYYDKTDRHFLKVLSEYNGAGLLITQTAYRENETVSQRIEKEYDQRGRCVESRCYESEAANHSECILKSKTQMRFDDKGRQIETRSFEKGAWGETSSIITYSNFDQHGNWLRSMAKYEYQNGHIKKEWPMMTRTIEYY